jgi:peptidoglycan hydrolase CwlO-like protein
MGNKQTAAFLRELAKHFTKECCSAKEDRAFFAAKFNAKNCEQAAAEVNRLTAEVERLKQSIGELTDFAQRPVEQMLAQANAEIARLKAEIGPKGGEEW